MATAVAENLQLKTFILILFSSLASKGQQAPEVEKHLSYIESHLARMDGTLKDYSKSVKLLELILYVQTWVTRT